MRQKRAVITGLGPITSIGIGKEDFIKNIYVSKSYIKKIPKDFEITYKFKSRYYIPLPEFELSAYGIFTKYENIMRMEDKIALLGTNLALKDAEFNIKEENKYFTVENISNSSVVLGIGFASIQTGFNSYFANIIENNKEIPHALRNSKIRYNRMIVPMMMTNSVASWVSIMYGLKGTSYTVSASCASGTYAIGEAYRRIKSGLDNIVITGGIECLHDEFGSIMRGFDMLGVLSDSEDGLSYPFSKSKNGFVFAEGGGCILLIEELEHALRRKAHIYAEIVNFQSNSDAYNIIQIEPSGTQIKKILKELKKDKKIDYLNSHGTGTSVNDKVEASAIKEVFGHKKEQPYINSTKGILGHTIGASGAIEAAVTVLSIDLSKIHGNVINDPIDDINIVENSAEVNIHNAISTSYGFGGHNAGILFKKWGEDE